MIRLAIAEDVPAITAVTLAAYAKWVPLIGREPLPMTVDYGHAFAAHRFDLIDEGGEPAALIETVPEDGWLMIVNVAVLPAFQKRGHGRRLLAHAERLAAEAGLAGTRLYTNIRFVENIRLYEAIGYQHEGEEFVPGGIRVNMRKPIA
jgi:ribosomal protein S18 acetylase RimI-like enzyme